MGAISAPPPQSIFLSVIIAVRQLDALKQHYAGNAASQAN
jgi:hypothetical protein